MRDATEQRAAFLLHEHKREIFRRTDRLFAGLMAFQWLGGIIAALQISPRTWAGTFSEPHVHVWAAVLLGGAIAALPIGLALARPGETLTRHTIAVGQMLTSALLIHLFGGRIETHFHIFGSLAFIAFYRDWRVLVTASVVVALDHFFRGIYWPQSVFGVLTAGKWRWLEHTAWVVFEDIFLIKSCMQSTREMRDIAERRAQLEATNEIIEAEVRARTAELTASQQQLREAKDAADLANRAKSEFLSNMSHELRTPLNGVLGYAQILQRDRTVGGEQRESLDAITSCGQHLLELINDVLDLAKIDSGKLEVDAAPCDFPRLLDGVYSVISHRAEGKDLSAELNVAPDVPKWIVTDGTKLRQVLVNLLGNAVKFTERGSVTLRVQAPAGRLEFAVEDTGC